MNTYSHNLLRSFVESLDTKDHLFKQAVLEGIDVIEDGKLKSRFAQIKYHLVNDMGLRQIGNSPYYKGKPNEQGDVAIFHCNGGPITLIGRFLEKNAEKLWNEDEDSIPKDSKWEEILASLDIDAEGNEIGPKSRYSL